MTFALRALRAVSTFLAVGLLWCGQAELFVHQHEWKAGLEAIHISAADQNPTKHPSGVCSLCRLSRDRIGDQINEPWRMKLGLQKNFLSALVPRLAARSATLCFSSRAPPSLSTDSYDVSFVQVTYIDNERRNHAGSLELNQGLWRNSGR